MSLLLVDPGKIKVMLVDPMTTHTHHIVYRSRGGTNDPYNLVEMDFIEHAKLHAEDFLSGGSWFDFRHEGYPYLDQTLRERLREKASSMQKGNKGNFGGGPPTALGKLIWNNGQTEKRSKESPGEGWSLGRLFDPTVHLPMDGRSSRNKSWWNNGEVNVKRLECPGPDWVAGCLPETNAKKGRPGVPKSDEWKENMKQIRVGDRNPCAGRRWVTDGVTNLYLKPGEEIPENYKPGRTL